MRLISKWQVAAAAAAFVGAVSAAPVQNARTQAYDLGPAENLSGRAPLSVTVSLKLRNTGDIEPMLRSLYTAGSPTYRKFLTTEQFNAHFGPTAQNIARVTQHFQKAGFQVTRLTTTHLKVSGPAAAMQAEFGVEIHAYQMNAASPFAGARFRAPIGDIHVADAIADAVQSVDGLDTQPRYRPHLSRATSFRDNAKLHLVPGAAAPNAANAPGSLTVADFASRYDVNPLYTAGVTGKGTTLAIVTLASFTPSDAYAYWQALGLNVATNKIHVIRVDGGSGPVSDRGGSIETTIDVEQSGGLAPGARVLVYEAPNSGQAYIDAYAEAIDSNKADTISSSWGEWELADLAAEGNVVVDPVTNHKAGVIKAFNDLFAQAAMQGQSVYVAAGDSGALDSTEFFFPPKWPPPKNSVVLSVDDPAAQQWVTAMGGTTLPGKQVYQVAPKETLTINLQSEQAWGWDYLIPVCDALGFDPINCGIFPAGGGGGVSSFVGLPFYQVGLAGVQVTAPGQKLLDYSQSPPALVARLPANFVGRNVPDFSVNSDPQTGYQVYYTDDKGVFSIQTGYGGTSFAAPQFNGVTSLYDQALHGRVGLLNFAVYEMARNGTAYQGPSAPFKDVKTGDIWGYAAQKGYDQATGIGIPDVANLLNALE